MDRVELRTRHGEGEGMDGFYERTPEIRPSRKNFSRLGWGLTALLLVPVAIQLLLLLVMGVMGPALLGDLWFSMALSTGSLYLVGYPLAWFLLRRLPEAEVEEGPMPSGMLLRMLFIALAVLYLTNYVTVILTNVIGNLRGSPVVNPLESMSDYPLSYNLLVTCILAPVAEEGLFRGVVLRRLRLYGERFALLTSALVFAMMHANLSQMLYAFTVGVVFGYVALRTGRIRETILLHAVVNFIGGCLYPLLEWLFPEGGARDMALTAMSMLVVFSILMGIIFFLRCRRNLWLEPDEGPVSEGRKWGLFFSSPGMVTYTLAVIAYVVIFLIL